MNEESKFEGKLEAFGDVSTALCQTWIMLCKCHDCIEWENKTSKDQVGYVVDFLTVQHLASPWMVENYSLIVARIMCHDLLIWLCCVRIPTAWWFRLARASIVASLVLVWWRCLWVVVFSTSLVVVDDEELWTRVFAWFFVSFVGGCHVGLCHWNGLSHASTSFIWVLAWSVKCCHFCYLGFDFWVYLVFWVSVWLLGFL